MRIWATSDLHADFAENRQLLEQLSDEYYQRDILIIAGDIADRMAIIEANLQLLKRKFAQICYVPGNHEFWVRGDYEHSLTKFEAILDLCAQLGIVTKPLCVESHWIVPLFSWYETSFDINEPTDNQELEGWADYHLCRWPTALDQPLNYFLELNNPHIQKYDLPVISFSHFLPRRELLPPVEYLRFKSLYRVAGSTALDQQVRSINSTTHIFGHSHINWDETIAGVRYIQNALSYPKERRRYPRPTIKQIWPSLL